MTLAPGLLPHPLFLLLLTLECTSRMREGLPFPRPCGGKGSIIKASLAWGPSLQDRTPPPPPSRAVLGFKQTPREIRLSVHLTPLAAGEEKGASTGSRGLLSSSKVWQEGLGACQVLPEEVRRCSEAWEPDPGGPPDLNLTLEAVVSRTRSRDEGECPQPGRVAGREFRCEDRTLPLRARG